MQRPGGIFNAARNANGRASATSILALARGPLMLGAPGPPQRIVTVPTISFSTLAKAMGPMPLTTLATRLRGHKYPSDGPKRSYQNALRQAVAMFVDGTPLDPMASDLRSHEREAVSALASMAVNVPKGFTASRPNTRIGTWSLGGVEVSMTPDAELASPNGVGAAKFSFTKEALPRGVGTTMAAILWFYRSQVLKLNNAIPSACLVYEPRAGAVYRPGANPTNQANQAIATCTMIATLWPTL